MATTTQLCAALAVLCASGAAAATEVRGTYGNWNFNISGTATENGQTYDFRRDLDARRAGKQTFHLAWDTGPGWWKPDLELGLSSIGANGTHTETTVTILPPPLPPTTTTTTFSVVSDFHDQELVARYPLNAGPLALSAGLAVKRLRGTVVITDSRQSQPSRGDYDQAFPELHLQLRYAVAHWLVLETVAQGVQYQDSKAFEWRAGLELRPFDPLLIEAGWQQKRYDIRVNSNALDVSLGGALLRAGLLFR
jgi:hypothetical protein